MPAALRVLLLASALLLPSLAQAAPKHRRHRRAHPTWYRGLSPVPVVRGEGTPPPRREAPPARPTPTRPALADRLAHTPVIHEVVLARKEWDRFNGVD